MSSSETPSTWMQKVGRDWADPGYFVGNAPLRNGARVLWQLIKQPKGHRTRMTRIGLLMVCISIGIGSAAFNTSQNMLYLALALLLSCLVLSGVLSWSNFKGARWRLVIEGQFRVGQSSPVAVELANRNRYLPIYSLWFLLVAPRQEAGQTLPLVHPLMPGETRRLTWHLTPTKRGVEALALQSVISKFPFGFLRKSIDWTQQQEVEIWPGRCLYTFEPPASARHQRSGDRVSRLGGGTELLNLRPYRPGDPLRQVSWKATARQGHLMVRETTDESQARYWVEVHTSHHTWRDGPQFERLCAYAASLAEDLFTQGRLAGVILNNAEPQAIQHLADLHRVLGQLARLSPVAPFRPHPSPHQPRVTFAPAAGDHVAAYVHGQLAGEA